MKFLPNLSLLAFLASGCIASAVRAEDATSVDPGNGMTAAPPRVSADPPGVLPAESNWRLGIALGYGRRTNPLIQSKDIPVVVDIDLAWFGKRWFFDNGDVGFALIDRPAFTTNLVARVNSDRAFFSKTNTRGVTFSYLGGGNLGLATNPLTGEPLVDPVPVKPPRRDYAVELGVETLLGGEWGEATFSAFRDVSGTHNGFEISADYSLRLTRGRFSAAPSVGISYKSSKLSDYYWGVHANEASFVLPQYHVDGGVGWEAGIKTSYYLTKKVRAAVSLNFERLQHHIALSPLVEQRYVIGYFGGISWQF